MIYLITDTRDNELPIPQENFSSDFVIKSLEGEELKIFHSPSPWTHENLLEVTDQISREGVCQSGADAYLGDYWVGSTEC